jgi:hypothetical protein
MAARLREVRQTTSTNQPAVAISATMTVGQEMLASN